ncbi:MAG: Flp pilus assembly complex ATPase component TadA [Methanospirillum sp.]|nr:Flp pilus assembly complex ATPase component TadA [Methanospirillum sp.]
MKIVPDTSVIIDGRITSIIARGECPDAEIIIPEAVVAELESQANQGREIGFSGLAELQNLSRMAEEGQCTVRFVGTRPSLDQVRLAAGGEIDAMIRAAAHDHDATFLTSDRVQSEVARAKGLRVQYLRPELGELGPLGIDQFFDEHTLAVYLKELVSPHAKRGTIRDARFVTIRDQPSNEYELRALAQEILERAKRDPDGFIEHESRGLTVVQIGSMRIVIARSPFVDGMEITAVRPVVEVGLTDYDHTDLLTGRLVSGRTGMLIAGEPGAGKTTLAQNLATHLSDGGAIVKTMEASRDMQVPDQISQYTAIDDRMETTAEMVMMLRPDYVVYDELRRTEDFRVFADMRLAGVGMVGVLHAASVEAALRRCLNRVDFGTLSRVITTIVTVSDGEVDRIYDLAFGLKAPESIPGEGTVMPVVTVVDVVTGQPALEVFRYGGETVIMPLSPPSPAPGRNHGEPVAERGVEAAGEERAPGRQIEQELQREIGRFTDGPVEVRMLSNTKAVVYIDDRDVPAAIGKGGKNVASIVNRVGVGIDIRPRSEEPPGAAPRRPGEPGEEGDIRIRMDRRHLVIVAPDQSGRIVDVFAGKEYLFTATVNQDGEIHLARTSTIAQEMLKRHASGDPIRMRPV